MLAFQKNVEMAIQESYDAISLFLCLHLVRKFRVICHKKGISALDKYWDGHLEVLWARLRAVVQLNTQSIKDCDASKIKAVDQRPHYVNAQLSTLSYTAFAC